MSEQQTTTGAQPQTQTQPASLKVGIILLWYPLFTQPFIFRDVEAVRQRLSVRVWTLYGKNLRLCSREMCQAASSTTRLGVKKLPAILAANLAFLARAPKRYAGMFCDHVLRRWPSLEVLGENLWAYLCGIYLAPRVQQAGTDILYAPWPRGTATAARVISQCTGIPYVTVARGDNLNPRDPDLVDKLKDACAIRTNNYADAGRIQALLAAQDGADSAAAPAGSVTTTADNGADSATAPADSGTAPADSVTTTADNGTGSATAPADSGTERGAGAKVTVIYNCLSLHVDSYAALRMQPPVRLLAAGRFDITKGFDVLLDACALLRDEHVPFTLTLVGGGGRLMGLGRLEESLHARVKALHLEHCVSFPGLVDHDAFPDILRSHDIFAAPCVIAPGGARDGIPNTLIEAMSFGLAVVATRVGALPEIVRDKETGLLVPQRDARALAQALRTLIEQPDTARQYAARGAELARELFSPQTNGDRLADFLEQAHAAWRARACAE